MWDKLKNLKTRYEQLTHTLTLAEILNDPEQYRHVSKEHADLAELVRAYDDYAKLQVELQANQEIIADPREDPELQEMAQQEIELLSQKIETLENKTKLLLLPKDPDDARDTILEIRAGTGGEEAALFVSDLFRMYIRYAELRKWRLQIIEQHETDIGGFKEIIVAIEGKDVYSR